MDYKVFLLTFISSISAFMFLSFIHFIRAKQEEPWKVNFKFKNTPPEYDMIPYHPNSKKQEILSYILIISAIIINIVHNPWWSSILILVLGKIIGEIVTRVFIYQRGYWGVISILNIVMIVVLIVTLF